MSTKLSTHSGFTLVEVMIVTAAVGILAALALPNYVRAREFSQKNACLANLKQIDGAISSWAIEQGQAAGSPIVPAQLSAPPGYLKALPNCPSGVPYRFYTVGAIPQVDCGQSGHVFP